MNGNSHFERIDRAPYELGYLLKKMPDMFSFHNVLTTDDKLIAEAARQHAMNANDTLMHGLEALGHVMFVAGNSEDYNIDAGQMRSLGCLIQHIAVESQFLQEMDWSIREALERQEKRSVDVKNTKKKNGACEETPS